MKISQSPQDMGDGAFVYGSMRVEDNAQILNQLGATLSRKVYDMPASAFREIYLNARESNQEVLERTGKPARRTEVILPSRYQRPRNVGSGYSLTDAPGHIMAHADDPNGGKPPHRTLQSGEMTFIFDPDVDWEVMHSTLMVRNYGTKHMTGDVAEKYIFGMGSSSKSKDNRFGGGLGVGIMAGVSIADDVTYHVINDGKEDFLRLSHKDGAVLPARVEPHSRPTSETEDSLTVSQVVYPHHLEDVFADSLYLLLSFPEDEAVDVLLPPYLYDRVAKILAKFKRPSADTGVRLRDPSKQGEWQFISCYPESDYRDHRFVQEAGGIKLSIDGCHYPIPDGVRSKIETAISQRLAKTTKGDLYETRSLVKALTSEGVLRYNAPVGQMEVAASRESASPKDDSFYDLIVEGFEKHPEVEALVKRMEREKTLREKFAADEMKRDENGLLIPYKAKDFTKKKANALRDYLNEFASEASEYGNTTTVELPGELSPIVDALLYFTFDVGDKRFAVTKGVYKGVYRTHIQLVGSVETIALEGRFKDYWDKARARMFGLDMEKVEGDWQKELFGLFQEADHGWERGSIEGRPYCVIQGTFAKPYENLPEDDRKQAERILGYFDNYDHPYTRQDLTDALSEARATGALKKAARAIAPRSEVKYRYVSTNGETGEAPASRIIELAKENGAGVVACDIFDRTSGWTVLHSFKNEWGDEAREWWGQDFYFVYLTGTQKFDPLVERLDRAAEGEAEETGGDQVPVYFGTLPFFLELVRSLYATISYPIGVHTIAGILATTSKKDVLAALIPDAIPDSIDTGCWDSLKRDVDKVGRILGNEARLREIFADAEGEDSLEENAEEMKATFNVGEGSDGYVDPKRFRNEMQCAYVAITALSMEQGPTKSLLDGEGRKEARKFVKQVVKFRSAMSN